MIKMRPGERTWVCLLGLFLLLFCSSWSRAQAQSAQWRAYTSMKDVRRLLIHQNAVWAITSGGVLRFDLETEGYTRFTRLDGLAGNQVSSLAADGSGHLWFGTRHQGLSRFRPETGSFDRPFREFESLGINALAHFQDRLFVGTERGISAFLIDKEEVKENYRQLGHLPKDTEVTSLAVFAGHLWAGTEGGLAWADMSLPNLQDPESWRTSTLVGQVRDLLAFGDSLYCATLRGVWTMRPERSVPDLVFSNTGVSSLGLVGEKLVAATPAGLFFQRLPSGEWVPMPAPEDVYGISDLSRQDSVLWVATNQGLKVIGRPAPPPSREPTDNLFFDMATSPDGQLWVASVPRDNIPPHGLYQFDGEEWTVHNTANGMFSDFVANVAVDAERRVWAGTWGLGVAVREGGAWRQLNQRNSVLRGITEPEAPAFVVISDIVRDGNGLMWIANVQAGLAVMDGFPPRQSLLYGQSALGLAPGRNIDNLSIGPDGLKWISTDRDGFILFDDGGTPLVAGDEYAQAFNTVNESRLASDRVSDILADQSGGVWVATDNGLNAVRGAYSRAARTFAVEQWQVYNATNGLPTSEVTALAQDQQGRVWAGTTDGLARIDADGRVAFVLNTANSGLIDNRINSLLFDGEKGALWIGTLNGLSRLRVEAAGDQGTQVLQVYPHPFRPGRRGTELTFAGLPLGASLEIFSASGELVRRLEGVPGQGTLKWDGQNQAGFLVGGGLYFYVADDGAGHRVRGKVAVVNGR